MACSSLIVLASAANSACIPRSYPCDLFTLDHAEAYAVVSRYGRSFFSTDCPSRTPREMVIKRDGYSVYLFVHGSTPPQAWLGVRPFGSSRFDLRGAGLRRSHAEPSRPTEFSVGEPVSHVFRTEYSPDGLLAFQVLDRETNKTDTFAFSLGLDRCSCKGYDGP